eukprot:Awhi_evm1s10065
MFSIISSLALFAATTQALSTQSLSNGPQLRNDQILGARSKGPSQLVLADEVTGASKIFIASDTKKPDATLEVDTHGFKGHILSYEPGGSQDDCKGQQLNVGLSLTTKDHKPFVADVVIAKNVNNKWEPIFASVAGFSIIMKFPMKNLSPTAPVTFQPNTKYDFHLDFHDMKINTGIGDKDVCVNLSIREIVAKIFWWNTDIDLQEQFGEEFFVLITELTTDHSIGETFFASKVCLHNNKC